MRRPLAILLVIVFLAGCNRTSSLAPVDPFFGGTRVPPPRTGMLPKRPRADPYYSSRRDSVNPQAPTTPLHAATSGTIGNRYQPPGGRFDYQGNREEAASSAVSSVAPRGSGDYVSIPMAARRETEWATGGAGRREADSLAGGAIAGNSSGASQLAGIPSVATPRGGGLVRRETVEQTLGPRPKSGMPRVSSRSILPTPKAVDYRVSQPRRSDGLIDIMDLPPVSASGSSKPRFVDVNVRQALATEEVSSTSGPNRSAQSKTGGFRSSSDRSRYGYDPKYKWLRGKLEYSQREGRWKLRYVPIDGETDDYGGSVVLVDVSRLSGYKRGDFVEVHGEIGRRADKEQGYAPDFKISRIVPLGQ
jgi:hypothetical protein